MTTTPLPPAIEPVAWFEYARKKPTLKRLVFDRTSRSQLRVAGWVSEPLVKESDATVARADLEAENAKLREALSEAADDIESWSAYASDYFQMKHDLAGCVAKYRTALAAIEADHFTSADMADAQAKAFRAGVASVQQGEPVALLHDDGYWTPMKTEAGRALNDRLMRAGSPSIEVYTAAPAAQQPQAEASCLKHGECFGGECIYSQQAEAVPPGYVLVPVEPTKAMRDAAVQAICYGPEGGFSRISGPGRTWSAMIAAAQGEKP